MCACEASPQRVPEKSGQNTVCRSAKKRAVFLDPSGRMGYTIVVAIPDGDQLVSSTFRGSVHDGVSQQGDRPTTSSFKTACVSFFYALIFSDVPCCSVGKCQQMRNGQCPRHSVHRANSISVVASVSRKPSKAMLLLKLNLACDSALPWLQPNSMMQITNRIYLGVCQAHRFGVPIFFFCIDHVLARIKENPSQNRG